MLKPTRNKRRIAALAGALALSTCLALGLAGCANSEGNGAAEPTAPATEQEANADAQAAAEAESGAITFTDDLGRTVELPAQIDKICPSGFTAQQVLLTMAPDKMVGLAQELNDDQLKIFGEKFADYPVFGAVLGAKDDLNREAVAAAAPQVIIDTGEAKKGAKEDLDALQEQLGIPVIFIEAKLSDYGAAYERLGELLGMEERGSELSTYCTDVYNMTVTTMENIPENERVRMAYLLGDNGLNAIAKTSFQAAVVDMVADNVVVVDDVSGKGNGNPSDVLLTLLDNLGFTDNYIECMVPTVGVYPIATANDKSQISAPLMSRFAVIDIPDYTADEKKIIFSKFALPKVLGRMQLRPEECIVTDEALDAIVARYADTTGIRDLEQAAEHIAANALYQIEVDHKKSVTFDGPMVRKLLD